MTKMMKKRFKFNVEQASKGQPTEAFTNLQCNNVTDKSIFVKALEKAGLKLVHRPSNNENDPNQLVIVLESQAEAYQIVKALHGCTLEGQTIHINVIDKGTQVVNVKRMLPKIKCIRRCIRDDFHERAVKERLARGNLEYPPAMQVLKVGPKRQKIKKGLTEGKEEAVALGISGAESDESKGLGEETQKQNNGEEQGRMPDGNLRPETSARQYTEVGETQSDLLGERCQIQNTARSITPIRSPTPDDFLSALYASLK